MTNSDPTSCAALATPAGATSPVAASAASPVSAVEMAEAVLASLRGATEPGARFGAERLAAWRATFVAAGTLALGECLPDEHWVELVVPLEPLEPAWVALMTSELSECLADAVDAGRVKHTFFMNKPPGLRLRLLGPDRALLAEVEALLRELRGAGVGETARVPYDPETHQFGGPRGLELAHAFFTHESLAVLAYQRTRLRGEVRLGPAEFSLVLLGSLLERVVDDRWELWDLWCKQSLTGRLPDGWESSPDYRKARGMRAQLEPLLLRREHAFGLCGPEEARALARLDERCGPIAEQLRLARLRGELGWGLRQILPFWVVFHWNRMGFDLARQRQLALLMVALASPKE